MVASTSMTVLAKKQTEAMNVARLSSSMRFPGCQDKGERVGSGQWQ
jgi:hypothetical protein